MDNTARKLTLVTDQNNPGKLSDKDNTDFKDGDDGGPVVTDINISIAANGYALNMMYDDGIGMLYVFETYEEVDHMIRSELGIKNG